MSIDSAIHAGRRAAERLMTDTCRITRPGTGDPVLNPTTGQYDDPPPIVVYEGPCRIPPRANLSTSTANAGEASWQVGEFPLSLPVEHAGYTAGEEVKPGQTVTYLTATDPALVGNVYGITEIGDQSQATARRFRMKRTVGA